MKSNLLVRTPASSWFVLFITGLESSALLLPEFCVLVVALSLFFITTVLSAGTAPCKEDELNKSLSESESLSNNEVLFCLVLLSITEPFPLDALWARVTWELFDILSWFSSCKRGLCLEDDSFKGTLFLPSFDVSSEIKLFPRSNCPSFTSSADLRFSSRVDALGLTSSPSEVSLLQK